jgi:hypothetical protein
MYGTQNLLQNSPLKSPKLNWKDKVVFDKP